MPFGRCPSASPGSVTLTMNVPFLSAIVVTVMPSASRSFEVRAMVTNSLGAQFAPFRVTVSPGP